MKPLATLLTTALGLASCTAGPLEVVDNTLLHGLVAHWSLDEAGGSVVNDDSGNRHHGMLTGATWVAGHFGGALHFEQGNEVAVPAFPPATLNWTVALWVRPPVDTLGDSYITLISTELVFQGGWEMNAKFSATDRRYQFGYYLGPGDSDYFTQNCTCVVTQQWTHLAAVVDGAAQTIAFYRDGLPDGPVAMPPTGATPGPIKPGNNILYLGRWQPPERVVPVDARLFKGDLDDVAIYDRALTGDEISALARSAVPTRK